MKYRSLGRTGLQVSEIGFGGWGIGKTSWIGAVDKESVEALTTARDAGINFFDTALAYGRGHSERLLAQTFGKSNEIIIASKVPPQNAKWPAPPRVHFREAFPKSYVLECLRMTLSNLRRETIDLYQFHVWSDEWAEDEEWLDTIEHIRCAGMVKFVGISINDHQPTNVLKALHTGCVDCVQVIYNIFDQSPEDELFPFCQKREIGAIARVPLDEGALTGKVHPGVSFPEGDFRNYYFQGDRKQQVWKRVRQLVADAGIEFDELAEVALRFCLSHPAVSSVIPGMRTPVHVQSNVAASDDGNLPDEMLSLLRKHRWTRNFYSFPQNRFQKVKGLLRRLSKVLV